MSEGVFFTYPIEATRDNWVSEWLQDEIVTWLRAIDAGAALPALFHVLPVDYRDEIARFTGIEVRFRALMDVAAGLSPAERCVLVSAVESQNDIPKILDGVSLCVKCETSLPETHERAKDLYEFCFGRLAAIKSPGSNIAIRDAQYQTISDRLPAGCCPFCGMGRLEAYHPDLPREDLDHYLAISKYPFAGVNLKNLAPMCKRCNSSYKRSLDIMHDDDGCRSACTFPYGQGTMELNLRESELFGDENGDVAWVVEFCPDGPETRNWDRVFQVRMRYTETVLRHEYRGWLVQIGEFICRSGYDMAIREEVVRGLQRFRGICRYDSLVGIGLAKSAVVDLLIDRLRDEDLGERLYDFLRSAWGV